MKLNDKLKVAKEFSAMMHADKGQMYGTEPYSYHLQKVVDILLSFDVTDRDILAAGYLHDIVEDADVGTDMLEVMFGKRTAQLVSLVTDEPGANRKERKAATYAKIASDSDAVMVKLADRIANVQFSIDTKNERMFRMYNKEQEAFYASLFKWDELLGMWDCLYSTLKSGVTKMGVNNPFDRGFNHLTIKAVYDHAQKQNPYSKICYNAKGNDGHCSVLGCKPCSAK